MADHNEYLCRLELGAGHRKFGIVAPRKETKEEDEGGSGSEGFTPPKSHPLLGAAVQFSGEFEGDSPLVADNEEAKKELQNRLEAKNQLKKSYDAQPSSSPSPRPF